MCGEPERSEDIGDISMQSRGLQASAKSEAINACGLPIRESNPTVDRTKADACALLLLKVSTGFRGPFAQSVACDRMCSSSTLEQGTAVAMSNEAASVFNVEPRRRVVKRGLTL